ncbi:DUF4157 domain-containing protein [bacterium]|nr:DUF4157 domain-containing protein [bacterium]
MTERGLTQKNATLVFHAVQNGLLQRQCACGNHTVAGGECEECRKKREGMLQRSSASSAPVNEVPPIVHEVLRSPGQPLDSETRAFMEPRFGHNFCHVRVHTDAKAAESARAVNALAYTVGRDVVFGDEQYAPHTNSGRRLMAHELTHVTQQAKSLNSSIQRKQGAGAKTGESPSASAQHAVDEIQKEQAAEQAETLTTLDTTDALAGLKYALNREDKMALWSLLDGKRLRLTFPITPPRLLPVEAPAEKEHKRFQAAFGPFTPEEATRALPYVKEKTDWFAEMLRPRETRESPWDLWIMYENDGSGIVPNFGSGSDQGRTAALYLFATFNKQGKGLSRAGVTGIEMITPRGTLPLGASHGPESTYQASPGPYSGIVAVDFGVTVYRSGASKVDFIGSAGVDSCEWGKLVQNFIHEKVSNSPIFPWPTGTKPLLEGGVTWNHTINGLTSNQFAGLEYTGRLELDGKAILGTRRTEGMLSARFVVRTARVYTPIGAISAEYSPIGALARGFVRYNDGRVETLPGVESGINTSLMVNIDRIGMGLVGEAIMSTDPAFQTLNPAGTGPAAFGFGTISSAPFGHHGTGQLVLRIGF